MAQQSKRVVELISEIKPQDPLYNEQITMTSAVEWYYEQTVVLGKTNYAELLEQAKQMEKEQTVNAWERGKYIGMSFPQGSIPNEYEQNGTQYYNQTYIEQ